jgi:hypothetical protein
MSILLYRNYFFRGASVSQALETHFAVLVVTVVGGRLRPARP